MQAAKNSAAKTNAAIWQTLQAQAEICERELNLAQALKNPDRFTQLSLRIPYMLLDCSKCFWDETVLATLLRLAQALGLEQRRAALYSGGVVNVTEQLPALHTYLRASFKQANQVADDACAAHVHAMLALAHQIRSDARFQDVVHIGIGGSSLGPELALQALQPWCVGGPNIHIVSNMDGHHLQQTLQDLDPARTLFIVASKSWMTAETQRNMASAKAWLRKHDPDLPWRDHFIAVTSREDAARQDGFVQTLGIPSGIGGRFSIWSAVALPVVLAVGAPIFARFLTGATEMDAHFGTAPLARNAPVWLGLLDVWYSSFLRLPGRCVAPYHHGLRRLPAYLQQLEMESNGKRVKTDGSPVDYPTAGMVWGEPGTNGQHAFFQWLHQGTQPMPVDFIAARTAAHNLPEHQEALLANALAQAQALMQGSKAGVNQLPGHQDFPGNRPSTFMLLDALTPESLGALLALHEHRVFVAGSIWDINSFDQWGVELGKTFSRDLRTRLSSGDLNNLDASTAGLLQYCRTGVGTK